MMNPDDLRAGAELALGRGPIDDRRLALMAALLGIYEDAGVMGAGDGLPLWHACACASSCWASVPPEWRPGWNPTHEGDGAIALPWIGRHYEPGGIAVLGINLREASGLFVEWEIAYGQFLALETGGQRAHGSPWAERSCRAAAAVFRSQAGRPDLDADDARELARTLDRIARLQTVKCSPRDGGRSGRTDPMKCDCPPRYLRRELAVLRPGVLLSFGLETWDAVDLMGSIDESVGNEYFSRSAVTIDDLTLEMLWLNHPSGRGDRWQASYRLMLEELTLRPCSQRLPVSSSTLKRKCGSSLSIS
jgi:hypothetical protein